MVRLKDAGQRKTAITFREFQFQYGSIKSDETATLPSYAKPFQFQYGSIKRTKASSLTSPK